jgi:hypothetical protein
MQDKLNCLNGMTFIHSVLNREQFIKLLYHFNGLFSNTMAKCLEMGGTFYDSASIAQQAADNWSARVTFCDHWNDVMVNTLVYNAPSNTTNGGIFMVEHGKDKDKELFLVYYQEVNEYIKFIEQLQ